MKDFQANEPIFMIGMGRSGTTVISEVISSHKDLAWFSRYLNLFPDFPWITILDSIVHIPFIGYYLRGRKKQSKGFVSTLRKYLPHPEEPYPLLKKYCGEKISRDYLFNKKASKREKKDVLILANRILKLQRKKRLFAKFTGPPRIHYLTSIFPNAYFIHILRDPRSVISSLLKSKFWTKRGALEKPWWENGLPDEYIEEWISSEKSPVALAAIQWKFVVELTWKEKEILEKEKYIQVKYEDFVRDPHKQTTEIFRKLKLKDCEQSHRYISEIAAFKNMNFKYKRNLSLTEIQLIETLTHKVAEKSGYFFQKANIL
jgi:hypothetical protein